MFIHATPVIHTCYLCDWYSLPYLVFIDLTLIKAKQSKAKQSKAKQSNIYFTPDVFQVKVDIENSIGDIRPKIKEEIRKMGKQLADHAAAIQVSHGKNPD